MKRMKLLSVTLTLAICGSLLPMMNVSAAEGAAGLTAEELAVTQWKAAANESLSKEGVKSPYYMTGQWNDPMNEKNVQYYNWYKQADYANYCDPYYGFCLLKNVFDTSQVEATPSVGVINEVVSELGYECMPDFSNICKMYLPYESIGITEAELMAIPLPETCIAWRHPADYATEMEDYSFYYQNLLWTHNCGYDGYTDGLYEGWSTRDRMHIYALNAFQDYPIGCHIKYFEDNYGKGVKSVMVVYPYPDQTKYFKTQRMFTMQFITNKFNDPVDGSWHYEDIWSITFHMIPNEMDMQHIHGLLRFITPDADAIYVAIREDLYGKKEYPVWKYPNENYMVGYAPWKYYDKWYDIGTQTRIRSSYNTQTMEWANDRKSLVGYKPTSFTYDIAPRAGVTVPGYILQ